MNAQAVLVERSYKKPIMAAFHGVFSLGMFAGAAIGTLFIALKTGILLHMAVMASTGFLLVIILSRHLIREDLAIALETDQKIEILQRTRCDLDRYRHYILLRYAG